MSQTLTYTKYCHSRVARQNASATLVEGKWIYTLDGKYYSQSEFDEAFPVNGKLMTEWQRKTTNREDIDGTRRWMQ